MSIFALIIQILYEFRRYNEAFCIALYAVCVNDVIGTTADLPSYWRQFDGREGKAPH